MERYGMLLSAFLGIASLGLGFLLLKGRGEVGEPHGTSGTPAALSAPVGSPPTVPIPTQRPSNVASASAGVVRASDDAQREALTRALDFLFRERPALLSEADVDQTFRDGGIPVIKTPETIAAGERRVTWRGSPQGFPAGAMTVKMRNTVPGGRVGFESAVVTLPDGTLALPDAAAFARARFPGVPQSESAHATAVTWKFADARAVWIEKPDAVSPLRVGLEFAPE